MWYVDVNLDTAGCRRRAANVGGNFRGGRGS